MKKFIKKGLLFALPFLVGIVLLLSSYIILDPFKVMWEYNDYSNSSVIPNRDFVSTSMFIKNNKKYHYNSFVFGSSRTVAYKPESWMKYLKSAGSPFMFDASSESIYGIWRKIKFLESRHVKIDNALIIICRDETFNRDKDHNGFLFVKHPALSGKSKLKFHTTFFKAYATPGFLYNFFKYKITGNYANSMKGYLENEKIKIDTITNAVSLETKESQLLDQVSYYREQAKLFYAQKGEKIDSVNRIKASHISMMKEIVEVFKRQNTDFRVVISPLYEQVKFSLADKKTLNEIFQERLYDFSGKNRFTSVVSNYYETSHYRPFVGDSILKIIYTSNEFFGEK